MLCHVLFLETAEINSLSSPDSARRLLGRSRTIARGLRIDRRIKYVPCWVGSPCYKKLTLLLLINSLSSPDSACRLAGPFADHCPRPTHRLPHKICPVLGRVTILQEIGLTLMRLLKQAWNKVRSNTKIPVGLACSSSLSLGIHEYSVLSQEPPVLRIR